MSAPCFGWALDQGRERKLPTAERFVLVVLSNRANPARLCWPSLPTIAADTGLSARTVFAAVHSLAAKGLIEIKRFGRRMEYRILRPNGQDRPTSAPQSSQPVQGSQVNGHKLSTDPVEIVQDLRSSQPVQGSEGADSCKSCIAIIANGESTETPKTRSSPPVSEDLARPQTTKKENLERKQVAHADLEGKQASKPVVEDPLPTVSEIEARRKQQAVEHAAMMNALPPVLANALGRLGSHIDKIAYAPGCRMVLQPDEQKQRLAGIRGVRSHYLTPEQLSRVGHRAVPAAQMAYA